METKNEERNGRKERTANSVGDSFSTFLSNIAYRIHPKIGKLYDGHTQFFNDQFVECIGLLIANAFVAILSFYVVGLLLAVVLLFTATPVTMIVKYEMRKHWAWKR